MSSPPSTFYSCHHASESELLQDGASKLSISYQYELEYTSTGHSIDEAMERVQASMLQSVAELSGLGSCAGGGDDNSWRRLAGDVEASEAVFTADQPRSRRRLRAGGRGSNSIVGLSSEDAGEVTDALCSADATLELEARTSRIDNDPFDNNEKEVTPGLAEAVVMGDDEEEEEETNNEAAPNIDTERMDNKNDNDSIILDATLTDGALTVRKSVHDHHERERRDNEAVTNSNDNLGMGLAFNYISTQSLPVERSSHTLHNPLHAPEVFVKPGNSGNTRMADLIHNMPASSTLFHPRSSRKCTVIKGQMSVYASEGSSYENLEGRILAALTEKVNDENDNINMGTQSSSSFTDNVVLSVRMYDDGSSLQVIPTKENDPIAKQSPGAGGYDVSAINGGVVANENIGNNSSWFDFTAPMAILVGLTCMLIGLLALFAHTGRKSQKQKARVKGGKSYPSDDPSSVAGATYYDDEVEMDVERSMHVMKSYQEDGDDEDDGFSVNKYSVSSAQDTQYLNNHRSVDIRVSSKKSFLSGAPVCRTGTAVSDASSSQDDESVAAPVQSSFFGLFAVQPQESPRRSAGRYAGKEEGMETELQSVYDCDASTSSYYDGGKDVAGVVGYVHNVSGVQRRDPPANGDNTTRKRGFFGALFGAKKNACGDDTTLANTNEALSPNNNDLSFEAGGKKPAYNHDNPSYQDADSQYAGPVDTDALANDDDDDIPPPPPRPVTPSAGLGCGFAAAAPNNTLQFFSARDKQRPLTSPHSEVEASLRPFDDVSEYSASVAGNRGHEVESNFFFKNVMACDDRLLLEGGNHNGDDDDHGVLKDGRRAGTRMVRKFNKMFLRGQRNGTANDDDDDTEIREIHQIYSNDEVSDDPKRTAETPIYTMQRKSPTTDQSKPFKFLKSPSLLGTKRSRSQANNDAHKLGLKELPNVVTPTKEGEEELNETAVPKYVQAEDEESGMVMVNGIMCGDQSWIPECWR